MEVLIEVTFLVSELRHYECELKQLRLKGLAALRDVEPSQTSLCPLHWQADS